MSTYKIGDRVSLDNGRFFGTVVSESIMVSMFVPASPLHCEKVRTDDGQVQWWNRARMQHVTTTFQKGDIVRRLYLPTDGERATVVKVKKNGLVKVRMGNLEHSLTFHRKALVLVERPRTELERLREEITKLREDIHQSEREQITAQYRSDVALLRAGLVRVELLAQWDAVLTPRGRETSLNLLTDLRKTITTAKERNR